MPTRALLILALAPFLLIAAATGAPAADDAVTRIPLLPPRPGNPRNSEGAFIKLEDGRILFVYTHFTGGGGDHDAAHLASRESSDGGQTWTAEDVVVLPNEGGRNVMSVSLLRLAPGEIGLFYLRKDGTDNCRLYLRRSRDEAKTWSEPTLCMDQAGYFVVNNDRVILTKSGRLVVPACRHELNAAKRHNPGTALCFLSDDLGRTWRHGTTELVPPPASRSGLQEPGVVELRDGRLMMLCRTDQGSQFRSYSRDGGDTWEPAVPTDILSPLSPASVKRIPSTGDLLMVWNDHASIAPELKAKRTPFTVAISKDDGATWGPSRILEDNPEGWYCYTAILFEGDRVLLGHCAGDRKVGGLNRTQITSIPVGWLYGEAK
ncbi:sialidase family protein [Tundrisphaera sp. TA3]|uniref:sialidase family protein n=1 Tax=Tundrisphaera sp. TA3 TaxID=3435775 RepID=UPI003EB734BD